MVPTHKLTISKPCAAALWVLSVATALQRGDFLLCSHPEHKVALQALHLHGARPYDGARPQTTRQGGLRTWGHAPASANLGNRGVGYRSTKNLSTAAEMGGAGRRGDGHHAPAGALREPPASAQ